MGLHSREHPGAWLPAPGCREQSQMEQLWLLASASIAGLVTCLPGTLWAWPSEVTLPPSSQKPRPLTLIKNKPNRIYREENSPRTASDTITCVPVTNKHTPASDPEGCSRFHINKLLWGVGESFCYETSRLPSTFWGERCCFLAHEGTWRVPGPQVASGKRTRGEGDQEEASWTSPGAPPTARPARTGSAVTQNTQGTPVPMSLPSARLERTASARSRDEAAPETDNEPSGRSGSHWPPRGLRGEAHPPAHRACASRPSRRPPAQPRSRPVAVATGSRGEGPRRGGCYFCRFLFLAATSPWQPSYSARPPPGPAGARDPGRSRPLVPLPHPPRCPRPAGRQIDGRRLLKHSGSVSVFMTLTRQRYLLLLFALAARELTFGLSQDGAWHPGVPLFSEPLLPGTARGEGLAQVRGLLLEGEKGSNKINK